MKIPGRIIMQYAMDHLLAHVHIMLKERPDIIVIEQQAENGTKLKGIGIVIQSFFYMYYKLKGQEPPPIVFQSGSQKLKVVMDVEGINAPSRQPTISTSISKKTSKSLGAEKSKYKQWKENKDYCEAHFEIFLKCYARCRKWLRYYTDLKKRNDVADAAFHAVFFLCIGSTRIPKNHPGFVKLHGDGSQQFGVKIPLTIKTHTKKAAKAEEEDIVDLTANTEEEYEEEEHDDFPDSDEEEDEQKKEPRDDEDNSEEEIVKKRKSPSTVRTPKKYDFSLSDDETSIKTNVKKQKL
jgi:hypothetical protein